MEELNTENSNKEIDQETIKDGMYFLEFMRARVRLLSKNKKNQGILFALGLLALMFMGGVIIGMTVEHPDPFNMMLCAILVLISLGSTNPIIMFLSTCLEKQRWDKRLEIALAKISKGEFSIL